MVCGTDQGQSDRFKKQFAGGLYEFPHTCAAQRRYAICRSSKTLFRSMIGHVRE
jgi:hypothetical protein